MPAGEPAAARMGGELVSQRTMRFVIVWHPVEITITAYACYALALIIRF